MRMRLISTNCRATSAAGVAGNGHSQVSGAAGQASSSATAPAIGCRQRRRPSTSRRAEHRCEHAAKQRTLAAARHNGRRQHHHCDPAAGSRVVSDPLQVMGQREGRLERGGAVAAAGERRAGGRPRRGAAAPRSIVGVIAARQGPARRAAARAKLPPSSQTGPAAAHLLLQAPQSRSAASCSPAVRTSCAARLELKAGGPL